MLRWYRFTWGFFFSERLSVLNILSNQTHTTEAGLTMTSREIAELTGKNHADVLRDIRNMLEVLKKDASIFAGIYKDAYGRDKAPLRCPVQSGIQKLHCLHILALGLDSFSPLGPLAYDLKADGTIASGLESHPHIIHDCGWSVARLK